MAHLVTIPTTGTGINLALCLQSSMEKRKPGMIDYVFLELDSLPKRSEGYLLFMDNDSAN